MLDLAVESAHHVLVRLSHGVRGPLVDVAVTDSDQL
jgi:hypothetical protein